MKAEYLLFNLLVISGPVVFSFDRRIHYVSRWPWALLASGLVMVPYIIWDALVTGSHWWFNGNYTLDLRLVGLPMGEWLFFIAVPFSCLFVWDVVSSRIQSLSVSLRRPIRWMVAFIAPLGLWIYVLGREYTGLVVIALGLALVLDQGLNTRLLFQSRTYVYLAIVTGLILVFNGYLTARPVVLYGPSYQLGVRIGTIPVEDVVYGYGLILFNTILYEKLRGSVDP